MWAGIYYGGAFCLAALSLLASHFPARRSSPIPITAVSPRVVLMVTGFLVLLGAILAVRFDAFYRAHWTGVSSGSVRWGAEDELARYHNVLSLLCFTTGIGIAVRLFRKELARAGLCGLTGAAAAAMATKAFFMSVPLSGDDGILRWIVLIPLFAAAAFALAAFSAIAVVIGAYRLMRREVIKADP